MPDLNPHSDAAVRARRLSDEQVRLMAANHGLLPGMHEIAFELLELRATTGWQQSQIDALKRARGERVGYITGYQDALDGWVIPNPCIPWEERADADNARDDAEPYTLPGQTVHTLTVYLEERHA